LKKSILKIFRKLLRELNIIFRFHLVETWMATIDRSMGDTKNTEVPLEQYKLLVNKFKVCQSVERFVRGYENDLFI
jgi:hypothetical protein